MRTICAFQQGIFVLGISISNEGEEIGGAARDDESSDKSGFAAAAAAEKARLDRAIKIMCLSGFQGFGV